MGRTRQEVRLEAIRTLGQVSEVELDTMMENETRILPKIFQQYKVSLQFTLEDVLIMLTMYEVTQHKLLPLLYSMWNFIAQTFTHV